jgi:elongation factor 2
MLGKYLPDELLETWQVSFSRGSLCIGSALDKWSIDIQALKRRTMSKDGPSGLADALAAILDEIVETYAQEKEKSLTLKYPVDRAVLDALVRTTPDPPHAQRYRVPVFWRGDQSTAAGRALLECKTDGPCIMLVGDVQPDKHAGIVAAVRVFSGTLQRAKPLKNLRTGKTGKSLQVGLFMSKTRIQLPSMPAGNLAFMTGMKELAVGDTIVSEGTETIEPMAGLQYPTEPVVTYTLEPKRLADLSTIQGLIADFVSTDPALEFRVDPDTGEMLLSGAGELHIEVTVEKLAREGIEIVLGKPMVLLREQMTTDGATSTAGGGKVSQFHVRAILTPDEGTVDGLGSLLDSDVRSGCYLVDATGTVNPFGDEAEPIREAFNVIVRNGPVSGERMRKVSIIIQRIELHTESSETSWHDITQPLLDASRKSVMTGKPMVLEPWIHLEISTPEEHVGTITAIVSKRKGRVLEIDSERALYRVRAEIPVGESFGLATEIRTSTSGWATWGARAGGYRRVGASANEQTFT